MSRIVVYNLRGPIPEIDGKFNDVLMARISWRGEVEALRHLRRNATGEVVRDNLPPVFGYLLDKYKDTLQERHIPGTTPFLEVHTNPNPRKPRGRPRKPRLAVVR